MNKLKLSNLLYTKMACLQGSGGPQVGEVTFTLSFSVQLNGSNQRRCSRIVNMYC